jgi:hypothetical protein
LGGANNWNADHEKVVYEIPGACKGNTAEWPEIKLDPNGLK